MNRLLFAGTGSGCGKTTVTCAFLSACKLRGLSAASFKCGPDYIDTMFHREITGINAHNLDPYFCGPAALREQFVKGMGRDISVMEGAMGYYDGIALTEEASAYTVARETGAPVVLVVNARAIGNSAGALIEGFRVWRGDSGIEGVVFNNANEPRTAGLATVAARAGVRSFGFLPYDAEMSVKSRHLGLVTAGEIEGLREKLARLGEIALKTLDIDGLLALSRSAPAIDLPAEAPVPPVARGKKSVRIAVARDEAFCFRYAENMEALAESGAEIVYFSPLRDRELPQSVGGLYLCGGYPELYADALSSNAALRGAIQKAVQSGMPTIAECGGFLFLQDALDGHPMVGAIRGRGFQTEKPRRFGYAELTARADNLLCAAGETIRAHEFHYWDSDNPGDGFVARKAGRDMTYACGHATETLYAGFPHLYFPGSPAIARRFTRKAEAFA